MTRQPERFEYGNRPSREEIDLYDHNDPETPRRRASHWLVRTNSRLLLVKAFLSGTELTPTFVVPGPTGDVPFGDLDIARDWAPIQDWRVQPRAEIVRGRKILVGDVEVEAFVAIDQTRVRGDHYGWAYIRVNGQLRHCGTMWLARTDVEGTLVELATCIENGLRE